MDVAPPPASPVRFQEVDDRLVVYFRPKRSGLVFLTVWLTGWTFFGVVAAAQLPKAGGGGAALFLLWLCGWAFGECFVTGAILWQLVGRESLAVTPVELVDRKKIGRVAWWRSYDASRVDSITTERVPHGEDEKARKDFCLQLSYDGGVARVGEGMDEREADYVASVVLARIRPGRWWTDASDTQPHSASVVTRPPQPMLEAGRFRVAQPSSNQAWLLAGAAITCVVVVGSLLVAAFGEGSRPRSAPEQRQPRTLQPLMPSRANFATAREYAEAMTSYILTSGHAKLLGKPRCGARATWTHWSCHVAAKDTIGPFAGRPLRYRCASEDTNGPGSGWICGPDPPIGLTAPP